MHKTLLARNTSRDTLALTVVFNSITDSKRERERVCKGSLSRHVSVSTVIAYYAIGSVIFKYLLYTNLASFLHDFSLKDSGS